VTLDPCLVMCCPCKGICLDRNIPDISNPHHLHTDKKIKEYKKKFSFRKKIGIKAIKAINRINEIRTSFLSHLPKKMNDLI
jgi:hypothetical protein